MKFLGSILLSMFIALVAALIMNGFDLASAKVTLVGVYTLSMLVCLVKMKEKEDPDESITSNQ